MNLLLTNAPNTVIIDGAEYPVNTGYRNCLLTVLALEDTSLTDWEKAEILIENLYYEPYPDNLQAALDMGVRFLTMDKERKNDNGKRLFDFEKDASYIYAALLSHGLDLNKNENLHWWTFMSHFSEISDSFFNRLVYLRTQLSRGKITKEERAECNRIGWDVIGTGLTHSEEAEIEAYLFGVDN